MIVQTNVCICMRANLVCMLVFAGLCVCVCVCPDKGSIQPYCRGLLVPRDPQSSRTPSLCAACSPDAAALTRTRTLTLLPLLLELQHLLGLLMDGKHRVQF